MNKARWLIVFPIMLLISCADPQGDSSNNNNNFLPSGQWIQNFPDSSPSPRIVHALAYDTDNQWVILFGGVDANGIDDSIWIYDPEVNTWLNIPAAEPSPTADANHAMVYDPVGKRVIIFGGTNENLQLTNETWAYDVAANIWIDLDPPTAPSPRGLTEMVYVPDIQQAILFGGETEAGLNNETWIFDLSTDTWQEITPLVAPSPRLGHQMVYDSFNNRVILFGGETEDGSRSDETWLYDVFENIWILSSPSVSPSPRSKHAMTYDAVNRQVLIFGGFATDSPFPNGETWIYDNDNWSQLSPPFPVPVSRFLHTMVYASSTLETILFGGAIEGCGEESGCVVSSESYKGDTWTYTRDTP